MLEPAMVKSSLGRARLWMVSDEAERRLYHLCRAVTRPGGSQSEETPTLAAEHPRQDPWEALATPPHRVYLSPSRSSTRSQACAD